MIIEIISPTTGYYDLRLKKSVYERYDVGESWIVDPPAKSVEVYDNAGQTFHLAQDKKRQGVISSNVIKGFEMDINGLFSVDGW